MLEAVSNCGPRGMMITPQGEQNPAYSPTFDIGCKASFPCCNTAPKLRKVFMNTWALIVAAGQGIRLRERTGRLPKQFLPFRGVPLFWTGARVFSRVPAVKGIVFVLPPAWSDLEDSAQPSYFPQALCGKGTFSQNDLAAAYGAMLAELDRQEPLGLPWRSVLGGERRQDSVALGLAALPSGCDAVLVHDGARPFVSPALIQRILQPLRSGVPAAVPALPLGDTVKQVDGEGMVVCTLERSSLRAVQTPQGFMLPMLRKAHERATREGWDVTDDASLLERCGMAVQLVPGDEGNRKITTPDDLDLLGPDPAMSIISGMSAISGSRETIGAHTHMIPCSGFGYDVHRYDGDRPFILGGVPIACDVRVKAHSDGDTLLHALMDALLGCIGAGDIGLLFPDDDPALDNIPSGVLLSEVLEHCRRAGLVMCHVDITIVAQVPRIAPHRQAIAANLAKLLQLPLQTVNVKATTEEGLGFTGAKQGIKVMALVSGLRPGM